MSGAASSIILYIKLNHLKFMLLEQDAIHIKLGVKKIPPSPLADNSSVVAMTEFKSH